MEAAAQRVRATARLQAPDRLFLIAADHPARGALAVRDRPLAMASRHDLLDRLRAALARPGVHGILAAPDVVEDLLLLGALDGKVVFGSMNRGGLLGSVFEADDRFTGFDADAIAALGLDGGKMLCRIDPSDPVTVATLESCARAVTSLARRGLIAMVEPFWSARSGSGPLRNDLSPEAMIRAVSVASALGATSAYTWLKLPAVPEMDRVMAATTLPTLLLGGDPSSLDDALDQWGRALRLPGVRGLVVGRALLYPPDDDVTAAVDAAAALVGEDAS
ncbi:Cgl0159 family (beta/alpha)8-fold protein [Thermoactinospora rubra]|uniref:Cgl0159 family (beta/alpha)8-fold protein n=1 Tax=Thermoactinospora rubra TaxID=1088767 RepID=UPI001980F5DB|nr:deoxyribose-phosphate aldolase [Thermoactinospora rubra]